MSKIINRFIVITTILVALQCCTSNENKKSELTNSKINTLNTSPNIIDSNKYKEENRSAELESQPIPSDDCSCDAVAYITQSPDDGIELFKQEKKVVTRISFDEENEEFFKVELKNSKGKMFQIQSLSNPFDESVGDGNEYSDLWIKSKYLRIFLPDTKGKVNLYSEPDEKSRIISEIITGEKYSIQLVKCCNNWIYGIHYDKNGQQSEGWLHPNDICSSPITNC